MNAEGLQYYLFTLEVAWLVVAVLLLWLASSYQKSGPKAGSGKSERVDAYSRASVARYLSLYVMIPSLLAVALSPTLYVRLSFTVVVLFALFRLSSILMRKGEIVLAGDIAKVVARQAASQERKKVFETLLDAE